MSKCFIVLNMSSTSEGWMGITGPHPPPKSHVLAPSATAWDLASTAKPREGVTLTRHYWANDLHDSDYRPSRMKFPQELNGYVFKTKASHLDGGYRMWSAMERDGLRHATLPKTPHEDDNHISIHTWSGVAQNKDQAFRCWPSGLR